MNPGTHNQGKIIAEQDDDGFLILFPNGIIEAAPSRKTAERKIKSWCSANAATGNNISFAVVEWRS